MIDRITNISRIAATGLLLVYVASAAGCGDGRPQRVPVSGTVLIDGAPVPYGFVTFAPAKGRTASGQLDKEGHFTLTSYEPGDGTLLGTQRVAVLARESISETKAKWHAPKKYGDYNSSGIVVEITELETIVLDLNVVASGLPGDDAVHESMDVVEIIRSEQRDPSHPAFLSANHPRSPGPQVLRSRHATHLAFRSAKERPPTKTLVCTGFGSRQPRRDVFS